MLAAIRRPDGGEIDLTLTTNGSALRALARPLAAAGLQRVTVSLDSLDDAVFGEMNGIDFPVARVLDGIEAALEAGLAPIKVNMVVRRGVNELSLVPMAAWARETGVILRCIEYMDVGHSNGWRLDEVVPAAEIVDIAATWPVEPPNRPIAARSPVAGAIADGGGEFGVISSVTQPFCRDCTRARISAEGMLYTCLFAVDGPRPPSRRCGPEPTDEELRDVRRTIWLRRGDRYSELRSEATTSLPRSRCSRWAADRQTRSRRSARFSPQAYPHRRTSSWTAATEVCSEFVDNRVDPPSPAPNEGLAQGADRTQDPRSHQGVRSAAGRFGRFVVAQVAVSPRLLTGPRPTGRDRHPGVDTSVGPRSPGLDRLPPGCVVEAPMSHPFWTPLTRRVRPRPPNSPPFEALWPRCGTRTHSRARGRDRPRFRARRPGGRP